MKISVVTCTFNRGLQMKRGLQTILDQSIVPDELIIIDDGSTDDTYSKVQELISENLDKSTAIKYVFLPHPEHRISSIPRNVGFKQSTGDIVFFTEPECIHVGNTIEQLLGYFNDEPEKSHLASQVWTIQRKIYEKLTDDNFNRPATILGHQYAQLTDSANLTNTKAPDSDWAITGQKNCAAGCLFLVKRDWFEAIGGFDESFEGAGFDDFDLYERLALYGHGIIKHDDVVVIHQYHPKDYPYNIYDMAQKNGRISADNVKLGIFKVNQGKEWGEIK